jgi:hypothetical protein
VHLWPIIRHELTVWERLLPRTRWRQNPRTGVDDCTSAQISGSTAAGVDSLKIPGQITAQL